MAIKDRSKKKNKNIAFISNIKENEDQCEKDTEESLLNAIAFLGREFNKVLKRLDKILRTNVEDKVPDNFKNISPQHKSKYENKPNKGKGIQCHECEGFCHIKT